MKLMKKTHLIILILALHSVLVFSQAGNGVYKFLELPTSSHLAALGSTNISISENDISSSLQNPALLTSICNNVLSLNSANYLADIKFGSVGYARSIDSVNTIGVGIQYVDYGIFKGYTETNIPTGDFTAKDYALNIIYSRKINNNLSVGTTLKPLFSAYEMYTSYGVALDAGVFYHNDDKLYSMGFAIRNLGTQLKGYYSDENGQQHYESLPLNIEFGVSKKFSHAPLRVSLTLQNLQQWDFSYESTNQTVPTLDKTMVVTKSFYDNASENLNSFAKHAVFAFEFVPNKNFYATIAYNHRRQEELRSDGFKSMSGLSYGAGIKLYKFHLGFGMNQILTGNQAYYFSITTALNEFKLSPISVKIK